MKKFLFLLMVYPILSYSQNISNESTVLLDTSIYMNFPLEMFETSNVTIHNNVIYYWAQSMQKKKCFTFLCYDINNNNAYTIKAYFDKKIVQLNNLSLYSIESFWFDADTMHICSYGTIFNFTKIDDSTYKHTGEIKIDDSHFKSSFNSELINDSIKLFWGAAPKGKINMVTYNVRQRKELFKRQVEMPIKIFAYFTPRDVITTNKTQIFFTPSDKYIIYIYNTELQLTDSIIYNKSQWNPLTQARMEEILSKSKEPIDIIYDFSEEINSYSSIRRLLAFDNKLIVFYVSLKENQRLYLYDLWQQQENGNWQLVAEAVCDYQAEDMNDNRLKLFRKFVYDKGYVYAVESDVPILKKDYKTYKQYRKAYDDYIIEHDCILKIDKLRFK